MLEEREAARTRSDIGRSTQGIPMGEGDRSCDEACGTQNHQNGSRALGNRASGTAARVEPVQLEQQAAHATSTPSGPERQAVHELSSKHARIMPASTQHVDVSNNIHMHMYVYAP